jgi:hypothetical protein
MSTDPVTERLSADAGEREVLETFLDAYREEIKTKLRGLSEEDARRRLVPSVTTIGGMVKHLRWVEMGWFQRTLAAVPPGDLPPVPWSDEDPDADFRLADDDTVESVIAGYDAECARSRETAARFELTDTAHHHSAGEVSLRWIYLHMIEETARHAGHADILREQLDGSTG